MQILGAKRLVRAFERADIEARRRVALAVQQTAEDVAEGARMRVPVRTGELQRTIRTVPTPNPFRWLISAGFGTLKRRSRSRTTKRRRPTAPQLGPVAPGVYAMVVEFGSQSGRARQPAQPYMFPALEAAHARHVNRLKAALYGGLVAAERVG
jgi:hypothetical protein